MGCDIDRAPGGATGGRLRRGDKSRTEKQHRIIIAAINTAYCIDVH